jgi:hypothetical protein
MNLVKKLLCALVAMSCMGQSVLAMKAEEKKDAINEKKDATSTCPFCRAPRALKEFISFSTALTSVRQRPQDSNLICIEDALKSSMIRLYAPFESCLCDEHMALICKVIDGS